MKQLSFIVLVLAFLAGHAHAITAVPNPNLPKPPSASVTNLPARLWENSLSFGLTLTRGNSDTILTAAGFKTHRLDLTNEVLLTIDGSYGKSGTTKNNEALHGAGQYNHLFSDRFYCYLRGEGLHDDVADLSYRFTVSPGVGYYFIKNKDMTLAVEAGPGGVFEKLDGSSKNYAAARFAQRLERKWNAHARVWETLEFLPQFDQSKNFLFNAEIGVETALTRKISLRTVLRDNFINLPAPGRKQNDLKLISGVVYKF